MLFKHQDSIRGAHSSQSLNVAELRNIAGTVCTRFKIKSSSRNNRKKLVKGTF